MNDRELLEMAAKAAGMKHVWCDAWKCMAINLNVVDGFDRDSCWNPLKDDGDALRLAVKLAISINILWDGENDQYDPVVASYNGGRKRFEESMGLGFDDMESTRRAIVTAAAAIGKSMQ